MLAPLTLNIVSKLCEALETESIDYCHWKSNVALDRSASGENDLDLLIGRAHADRFTRILYRLGFKQAGAPKAKQIAGILDYYGYDEDTGKLVHVHAHYQLIVGHDMSKNYRVPIETPYLESAGQRQSFRVPAPEFEFIVFVIRMMLKYSTWDAILIKHGRLSSSDLQELVYLRNLCDLSHVHDILEQHLPYVDSALFERCVQALEPKCVTWARIKAGQQLQYALKPYARRRQSHDVFLKLVRRITWGIQRRLLKRVPKRRLASGGAMIAFVGGDGAGKSTAIAESYESLSKDLDVRRIHLGKPPWSWTTTTVRGILKLGRLLGLYPFVKPSIRYSPAAKSSTFFPGYPLLIREVCTARDRYLAYVKAQRFATNGGLVLCDRFPVPEIKLMDGAVVEQLIKERRTNRFLKILVALEKRYYQRIRSPQLLIVLRVNPDIAVKRKTDEDPAFVRARSQEIWDLNCLQTHAHIIDASRSKEEVMSELKSLIWSAL